MFESAEEVLSSMRTSNKFFSATRGNKSASWFLVFFDYYFSRLGFLDFLFKDSSLGRYRVYEEVSVSTTYFSYSIFYITS